MNRASWPPPAMSTVSDIVGVVSSCARKASPTRHVLAPAGFMFAVSKPRVPTAVGLRLLALLYFLCGISRIKATSDSSHRTTAVGWNRKGFYLGRSVHTATSIERAQACLQAKTCVSI